MVARTSGASASASRRSSTDGQGSGGDDQAPAAVEAAGLHGGLAGCHRDCSMLAAAVAAGPVGADLKDPRLQRRASLEPAEAGHTAAQVSWATSSAAARLLTNVNAKRIRRVWYRSTSWIKASSSPDRSSCITASSPQATKGAYRYRSVNPGRGKSCNGVAGQRTERGNPSEFRTVTRSAAHESSDPYGGRGRIGGCGRVWSHRRGRRRRLRRRQPPGRLAWCRESGGRSCRVRSDRQPGRQPGRRLPSFGQRRADAARDLFHRRDGRCAERLGRGPLGLARVPGVRPHPPSAYRGQRRKRYLLGLRGSRRPAVASSGVAVRGPVPGQCGCRARSGVRPER